VSSPDRHPLIVKIGGSALDRLPSRWWDDLADVACDEPVVCVHGWSRQLAAHQRARGRAPEFLVDQHGHRSRLTTPEVLADIRAVAAGVRVRIARRLRQRDLRVGTCSGEDDLLTAESRRQLWWREGRLERLTNLVGPVREVNAERFSARLRDVDALVLTPLARDRRHGAVNTDGDRAAACVAAALGAADLLLVTDVSHVMDDVRRLHQLRQDELEATARSAGGGMRKKLRAAAEALEGGVSRVHIGNAPPRALLAGEGTTVAS